MSSKIILKATHFFALVTVLFLLIFVLHVECEANYNTAGLRRHAHEALPWNYAHTRSWEGPCKTGLHQSPISFVSLEDSGSIVVSKSLSSVQFSARCHLDVSSSQVVIRNTDYGIHVHFVHLKRGKMVTWDSCLTKDPVNGLSYGLHEIDFHVGPEHHLPGVKVDAEMHIKFRALDPASEENALLYLSIPLKVSKSATQESTAAALLNSILTDGLLPPVDAMTSSPLPRSISLFELLPQTTDGYLTYTGSLTQPPCTEHVRWVVFTTPLLFSELAYQRLKSSIADSNSVPLKVVGNARPPQPLNDRLVLHFPGGNVDWKEDKEFTKKTAFVNHTTTKPGNSFGFHWSVMRDVPLIEAVLGCLFIVLCVGVVITVWRRWSRPVVVGVDPRDLQPLVSGDERRALYGASV